MVHDRVGHVPQLWPDQAVSTLAAAHHEQRGLMGNVNQMISRATEMGILDHLHLGEFLGPRVDDVVEPFLFLVDQVRLAVVSQDTAVHRSDTVRSPAVNDTYCQSALGGLVEGDGERAVDAGRVVDAQDYFAALGERCRGETRLAAVRGMSRRPDERHRPVAARGHGLGDGPHQKTVRAAEGP